MEKKRIRFRLYGDVQGVGLRFRASHAAGALGVTGYVRNEPDDSVTLEVQGTEEEIDAMFMFIEKSRFIRITDMRREELPLDPYEGYFHVR